MRFIQKKACHTGRLFAVQLCGLYTHVLLHEQRRKRVKIFFVFGKCRVI